MWMAIWGHVGAAGSIDASASGLLLQRILLFLKIEGDLQVTSTQAHAGFYCSGFPYAPLQGNMTSLI
jgi:hypothetical protein